MLEIKQLTKIYKPKKGPQVLALNKVDINFQDKGLVFLLGKSGSGKSTLLNLLGGLDSPTDGEVIIKGKSSKHFKQSDFDSYRNTFIGFIFQEFYILEKYSVAKNIGIALELQGKKSDENAINEILEKVDLVEFGNRKPNELSGGQKQRVAIARALIKDPQIILADEPTGSLDSNTGKQIFETLKKLSEEKLVIVVSHDRENSEKYADRIIELKDGQVIDDVIKDNSRSINEGIVFKNNLVYIKAGHKLTEEDTKEINSIIENASEDIVLSFDGNANKKLLIDHNIDTNISDGKFIKTKSKKLKIKEYTSEDCKFIKSSFPYKDSLRMGASGLKHKKIRLIFTILLSFIAFAMFGIADTMATYNSVKTDVNTFYKDSSKVISITYAIGYEYGKDIHWNNETYYDASQPFFEDNLEWIEEKIGNKKYYPVYEFQFAFDRQLKQIAQQQYINPEENSEEIVYDYNYEYDPYISNNINGIIELENQEDMVNLDLTLIAGKFPQTASEFLLPDYLADSFIKYNYIKFDNNGGSITKNIDDYSDLIGLDMDLSYDSSENYKISGIVSTGLDLSKYKNLENSYDMFTYSDLNTLKNQYLTCMIFVKNGFNFNRLNYNYNIDMKIQRIFLKTGNNKTETQKMFLDLREKTKEIDNNGYNQYYRLEAKTFKTSMLNEFDEYVKEVKKVLFYISLVFSLFSCLLLMNFISTSIANKKKDIGILRALGARGIDVYGIFFNESIIISLINFILAVVATIVTAIIINNKANLSIMVVGYRQILLMLAYSVGVAAIGSFLPIYKFAKKKPIDTINDK